MNCKFDEHYISISYGNSNRVESIDTVNFRTSEDAALFLEQVAKNIRKYKTAKEFRHSSGSVFNNCEIPNDPKRSLSNEH